MSSSAEWRKPRSGSSGRTDGYGRHPHRHPHFRGRRVHRDGLLADRPRGGRPDPRQERLGRWRRSAHRARGTEGCARSGARGRAAGGGGARRAYGFYGALAGQGAGRGGGETGPGRTAYGVHMMQAPMPPPLPGLDPNLVFNEVEPIIAAVVVIAVVAVALRWIFRTPVGEAIAERIRRRAQRRWGAESEDPERVAALEAQVSHLQAQVSELAERIDFAERMLAERRERKLGAGQ